MSIRTDMNNEFKLVCGVEKADGKVEFICWTILNVRLSGQGGKTKVGPANTFIPTSGESVGEVEKLIWALMIDRDSIDINDEPAMCGMESREHELGPIVFRLANNTIQGGFPVGTRSALVSFNLAKGLMGTQGKANDISHLMHTMSGRKFLLRWHRELIDGGLEKPEGIPPGGVWTGTDEKLFDADGMLDPAVDQLATTVATSDAPGAARDVAKKIIPLVNDKASDAGADRKWFRVMVATTPARRDRTSSGPWSA